MTRSTYEGRWLTTKQMSEVLGKHPLTLVRKAKKLVKDGVLEEGKHFFKSGASHASHYSWNYSEISKPSPIGVHLLRRCKSDSSSSIA